MIKRQQPLTLSPKNGLIEEGPARAVAAVVGKAADIKPPLAKFRTWEERSARDWQDDVFVQISESQTGRAVRTSRWKYSVRAPGGSAASADSYNEDFLYDLEKDPHERNNLVRDPTLAGIRAELRERLKRRMRHAGESEPGILPAKDA